MIRYCIRASTKGRSVRNGDQDVVRTYHGENLSPWEALAEFVEDAKWMTSMDGGFDITVERVV